MPKTTSPDYACYLPRHRGGCLWGLDVIAAGHGRIPPDISYPPAGEHPDDHLFDWERGRTLPTLQIVFIRSGSGRLETAGGGRLRVHAGMAFLLLPNEWHRYRPDSGQGWTESWAELSGPTLRRLLRAGVFRSNSPLVPGALEAGLGETLDELHHRLRADPSPTPDPERAALAVRLLALCAQARESGPGPTSAMARKIAEAEQAIALRFAEPLDIAQFARGLGIACSHFRREFRARTGLPPWRYILRLRMRHACRLLVESDAKIETIAEAVGFSSAARFSHAFKRAHGQAPALWRALRRDYSRDSSAPPR